MELHYLDLVKIHSAMIMSFSSTLPSLFFMNMYVQLVIVLRFTRILFSTIAKEGEVSHDLPLPHFAI